MGIIRRRDAYNAYGYGVVGDAIDVSPGEILELDMNVLCLAIGRRLRNFSPPNPSELFPITVRRITWRPYITGALPDSLELSVFSPIFEKKRYGRMRLTANGYVSGEPFWSYRQQIFDKYSFIQIDINGDLDSRTPCNEPVREIEIDPIIVDIGQPTFYCDTSSQDFLSFRIGKTPDSNIADKVELFIEPGVSRLEFGATFVYSTDGFEIDEWLQQASPPRLIF